MKRNLPRTKRRRKDFEITFYERLIKTRPNFVHALSSLGDAYTRRGFYKEGLAVDEHLLRLRPEDPIVHYNLACSLSLMEKPQEALEVLTQAILLGYEDFSYLLKDEDLAAVRALPQFVELLSKIRRLQKKGFWE